MMAVRAGLLYGLVLFGCGFLLALIRIPILVPRFGETAAVLIELPVLIGSEMALGLAMGSALSDILASWGRMPGSLAIAAQVAVAAFPVLRAAH